MSAATFELVVDGRPVRARDGQTLLEVARGAGIEIPTLCHLDGMPGYGACRLCVVELTARSEPGAREAAAAGGANGKIVSSCTYPARPGLEVRTRSEGVDLVRRSVLELLLARCPKSDELRKVAASLGVASTSYPPDFERDRCILCGSCVRVCAEVGTRAISAARRGPQREIATPFHEPAQACIGCLACAKVCPTHNIPWEEEGVRRRIWKREFERVQCPRCGRLGATREQIAYYVAKNGWEEETLVLCDACKRAETAKTFFGLMRL